VAGSARPRGVREERPAGRAFREENEGGGRERRWAGWPRGRKRKGEEEDGPDQKRKRG
jgi:hypothetical protein